MLTRRLLRCAATAALALSALPAGAQSVTDKAGHRVFLRGVGWSPWHAVYVETPALQQLDEPRRRAILGVLKLAQDLGAQTATLTGTDAIASLQFQFMGGTPPAAPGPTACGADPTPGDQYVECTYPGC